MICLRGVPTAVIDSYHIPYETPRHGVTRFAVVARSETFFIALVGVVRTKWL